jgi:heat shock protein 4
MLNACEIAQLHCLRLLHEGTAAALEYGMFKSAKGVFDAEKPQNVMFLDLGHASFTVNLFTPFKSRTSGK